MELLKPILISIHALVKRATLNKKVDNLIQLISIHALVKRATEGKKKNAYGWIISIHALVKRATIKLLSVCERQCYFNPRPRKEGDVLVMIYGQSGTGFQSTPS